MAKINTFPTPAKSMATSDYLPSAASTITTKNTPSTSDGDSVLNCPHHNRTFTSHIGLGVDAPSDIPTLTPGITYNTTTLIETTSQYLSPVTSTTATTTTIISDGDSVLDCPHCDRTFTSHLGLIGHLRIHRKETAKPVPGALTHNRVRRIHCPHCPRAFTHCMALFGHMRIHYSGIDRNVDKNDIECRPSAPANLTATATITTASDNPTTPPTFSYPYIARNFNSRIGLVSHL
ncbi:unnamed protein product [Schistocephalus solidus]|uniref:C2H2-type domain-containing protein n=1 Tax=Schistocephalus solidus TaxID=70667 RepID=A0A183TID6_SCHSO|nr:unnamed protein product [Schistocephalus solidus]